MDFIYDRNILDINFATEVLEKVIKQGVSMLTEYELSLYNKGLKGVLNYTDLNRIEKNTGEIGRLLGMTLDTKENWTYTDLPVATDYTRILSNLTQLKNTGYIFSSTPKVPAQPLNHYSKINAIEKILHDIYTVYAQEQENKAYIDEIYADEENGVI